MCTCVSIMLGLQTVILTTVIAGEAMVVAQSLALLATDSVSFLMALGASQLHSSPTMFNPPLTPEPTPHPLLRDPTEVDIVTLPSKILGEQTQFTASVDCLYCCSHANIEQARYEPV